MSASPVLRRFSIEDYNPEKVRILVADNNPNDLKLFENGLQAFGEVKTAPDEDKAWEILQDSTIMYSLVLVDRFISKDDSIGCSFLKKLKEHDVYKEIPVVVVSRYTDNFEETGEQVINQGATDYIVKPIREVVLRKKITCILENSWREKNHEKYLNHMQRNAKELLDLREKYAGNLSSPLKSISGSITTLVAQIESQDLQPIKEELLNVVRELGKTNLYAASFEQVLDDKSIRSITKQYLVSEFTNNSSLNFYNSPSPKSKQQRDKRKTPDQQQYDFIKDWKIDPTDFSQDTLFEFIIAIFKYHNLLYTFKIDEKKFQDFLQAVSEKYRDNPYHNFRHAFDVLQAAFSLVVRYNLKTKIGFSDLELLALWVACLCHDVEHPGRNNQYEINKQTKRAFIYNDQSVLENHHCATTFQILKQKELNILEYLTTEEQKEARKCIISMILATDMSYHFEWVNKFVHKLENNLFHWDEDTQLILNILIKTADISNVARDWEISKKWAYKVTTEFFRQSKKELSESLPIQAFMDETKTSSPRITIDFIDFVASALWKPLCEFFGDNTLYNSVIENRKRWSLLVEI